MKKERNELKIFLFGLAMLVAGGYWFLNSVTVSSVWGRGYLSLGGFDVSTGLVFVPFIIGVVWMFADFDSVAAKFVAGLGLLIIVASVIMSMRIHFITKSLYETLVMFVLMFGGLAMVLSVLLKPVEKEDKKKKKK